jgi:serine protease AprX
MTRLLSRLTVAGLTGAALLICLPQASFAQGATWRPSYAAAKLDKKLRRAVELAPKTETIIIRAKDAGSLELLKQALVAHGDVIVSEHPEILAITVVVYGDTILPIAEFGGTVSVSEDAIVQAGAANRGQAKKAGRVKAKKAIKKVQATKSNRKRTVKASTRVVEVLGDSRQMQGLGPGMPTGKGVGVAVVDSGIELSDDLAGAVSAFYDFTQGDYPVPTTPYDDFGHGTHIASLIAGQGKGDSGKFQGVAPGAHLIGMKVLDGQGQGKTSQVISAIEFAIQYKDALGIRIINLSLGHPIYESAATDPLVKAVEAAHRAGIVVVVSAGNFGLNPRTGQPGYAGITSPGNAPSAITVGALNTNKTITRADDTLAPFSSRGPSWIDGFAKPDVLAPGVGEVAKASKAGSLFGRYPGLLYDDKDDDLQDFGQLAKMSGTSMAAAEASGVVALVIEARPELHTNVVKAVLEYSATPLSDKSGFRYDELEQGLGAVNGKGAIEVARAIDLYAPGGAPWLGATEGVTVFGKDSSAWSQNIVWGNYLVRGIDSLYFNSDAWDDNIVWGTVAAEEGDNIVWGNFARDEEDNIVWGNLAIWGSMADDGQDNIVWGTFDREDENIVWGNVYELDADGDGDGDNIVWGNSFDWDDNIVWGNSLLGFGDDENIVWGNMAEWDGDGDNIVWGNLDDDNIVWGNSCDTDCGDGDGDGDNIVWGNAVVLGWAK